jgi:RecB family exonuclease
MSFGLEHGSDQRQADPQSVLNAVDPDCGIRLRGSIDLVERNPSGTARVTDHKTGKADASRGQLIAGGQSLRPLLYAQRGTAFAGILQADAYDGYNRLYLAYRKPSQKQPDGR